MILFVKVDLPEPDPLACEPAVHFIFDLVNDDDTVCRNTPFNLQKEVLFDIILRKTADMIWLREETILW